MEGCPWETIKADIEAKAVAALQELRPDPPRVAASASST